MRTRCADLLQDAIKDSRTTSVPIELLVAQAGYFKRLSINYHGGERIRTCSACRLSRIC